MLCSPFQRLSNFSNTIYLKVSLFHCNLLYHMPTFCGFLGPIPVHIWGCFWTFYSFPVVKLFVCPGLGRSPGGGNGYHSSILVWRIPWTEEPGILQSMGSQRVRHDWGLSFLHWSQILYHWATGQAHMCVCVYYIYIYVCVCVCMHPYILLPQNAL